ncbi:DUF2079 domain-containing protein [Pseudanabaena sp. FACHB-1277]|uniref:DUF2079 domain-containing protein n=1 Tax=Pseudanabaena cinerea FACHB-1277 TaxID=2949581 RepID=A0A926Z6D8_9CYAN|nr:DUF2079 domain-containing protein [Pseudanabaena cinerea]MBD2150605.1 DUF2079 domain-containing protein [Pseudanabaena cinerea FACHB-1277]
MDLRKQSDQQSTKLILIVFVISTLVLFLFASLRHSLFQSGALDLGFFDQCIWLLSQGMIPRSSIIDIHILGDHAAFILYPLSLFYKIHPDIHWIFLIHAITISSGIFPIVSLSREKGLDIKYVYLVILIYLLSPVLFNANSTYDFHPDIFAVPCLLWCILWAEKNKLIYFCLTLLILVSCKAVFSLTAIALGIWLVFKNKKLMGTIAITIGIIWFLIATQIVMPMVGSGTGRFIHRYSSLGDSYLEILKNLFLKPELILSKAFSIDSLTYLLLLFVPFIWCLKYADITLLIIILPTIIMSILSDDPQQRYLANHYPLPIVPILVVMVISSINKFTQRKKWTYRFIIFWSVLAFVTMSRLNLFTGEYLQSLDTWQANNEAIALVKTKGSILTTHEIAPHVTHRPQVKLAFSNLNPNLEEFDYILLNTRHPSWQSDRNYILSLVEQARNIPSLKLEYNKDDVYLFSKKDL